MSTDLDPRIRLECARTLYRQGWVSFLAASGVTLYMLVTLWPYADKRLLLGWLAAQLLTQVYRAGLLMAFRRADPGLDEAERWMRRYALYMGVAGLSWGSTAFLFFKVETPIAQALVMCGLYGITGGSVPGTAYYRPSVYAFVGITFGLVMVRMIQIGDGAHIALGTASVFFAAVMILFGRVQYRSIVEGFQIRFENVELLDRLRIRTDEAEQARRRAEQANLAKSQFLAAASHDLRQPLHALGLFSASLEQLTLDADGKEVVNRIHDSVHALESLFDALLDISRLDAGVLQAKPEPVAIAPMFDRLRRIFQPLAEREGVSLAFTPAEAAVIADLVLVEQILGNLIGNALRHAGKAAICVEAASGPDSTLRLTVRDDGPGIAPDDQARIFEEFVQLKNPERDRRKGLGLGLAIAQRLAALQGTDVVLQSAPGSGAAFSLTLPTTALPAAAQAESLAAPLDTLAGRRALLLDDEEAIREGFGLLLRQWGMRIDTAASVEEAAAMMGSGPYDVLLADFRLPGDVDGVGAIDLVGKLQNPAPAACLITGDMDADLLGRAQASGLPLLHKPVRPAKLRAVLVHLLSQ